MKRMLFLLLFLAGCSEAPTPALPPFVTVTQPIVCDVPVYLDYVGHLEANISVDIKAQVQGILTGQYFIEGADVKQGDLLLTIDSRPYQAALDKAEATLAQNLADLRQAKDTAERYSKLVAQEYISALDYDQYVTQVLTAEATVKQSYADVQKAKLDLEYCTIYASMNAVASQLVIKPGNYVPVGGSPLLTLNQITPILVNFSVPEKDLPRIQKLQVQNNLKTELFLSTYDRPFVGQLTLINNQVDENTGTVLMKASFPNFDKRLWPGEFVDIRVILETKKNAILLPSSAVLLGQDGPYIFVMKPDHTVELRNVFTSEKEDNYVIVEKGVEPEETVILEGQLNLYPGAQVAVKP